MPSTYAHRCFGRQVLAALPQEMQQLLRPEQALFSIALVLFLFIMLINATLNFFLKRNKEGDK